MMSSTFPCVLSPHAASPSSRDFTKTGSYFIPASFHPTRDVLHVSQSCANTSFGARRMPIEISTTACLSVGARSSQEYATVAPHVPQKPRYTPGDEWYTFMA